MIKFKHTDVYGIRHALRGMRNPLESWNKSDSRYHQIEGYQIGQEDLTLAMKLSKAGNDHGKYLRQIAVWVDITAGGEWWKEFDTYKVGTVSNSTSMMHKLGSRYLTVDDFGFDDKEEGVNQQLVDIVNQLINEWWASGKKKPSPEWRKLIQSVPQSFLYTRTISMNYQVLKGIYHSDRKNHRLQEWRDFCSWIESLPYSELITLKESK